MSREYRRFFLKTVIYTSFVCIVFLLGSEAWNDVYGDVSIPRKNGTTSRNPGHTLVDRLTTLYQPTSHLPSKPIHLGTDPMLVFDTPTMFKSDIGMCTSMHGKYDDRYQPAFDSHLKHSEIHGYPIYLLDRAIVEGLWSKEAALLEVLLHEMSKPEVNRLRWIMWFDADTLVTNPCVAAETFLPPFDLDDIHLLVTEDWNGLNNGVFFMRVSAWSINLLASILSYPSYRPSEKLPFTEQSAMEKWIQDPLFAHGCVYVPPRWFNSYPWEEDEEKSEYWVHKGDMILHFAGVSAKHEAIKSWHDIIADNRDDWEIPATQRGLTEEVAGFWLNVRMERETHF